MPIKLILITICILLTGNISAQESDKMEKRFDIKRFKENIENGEYRFQLNDTTEVVQVGSGASGGFFLERLIFNGSQKEKRIVYSFDKGKMEEEGSYYCGVPIGISKIYNSYGDLVQEKNEDEGYSFSMDDLRALIKKLFKVDILYPEKGGYKYIIARYNEEGYIEAFTDKKCNPDTKSIYTVEIVTFPKNPQESHSLVIDGNTGEILSHVDDKGKELVDPKAKNKTVAINKNDEHNWTPLLD